MSYTYLKSDFSFTAEPESWIVPCIIESHWKWCKSQKLFSSSAQWKHPRDKRAQIKDRASRADDPGSTFFQVERKWEYAEIKGTNKECLLFSLWKHTSPKPLLITVFGQFILWLISLLLHYVLLMLWHIIAQGKHIQHTTELCRCLMEADFTGRCQTWLWIPMQDFL